MKIPLEKLRGSLKSYALTFSLHLNFMLMRILRSSDSSKIRLKSLENAAEFPE